MRCGYAVRSGSVETRGMRAQPVCAVQRGDRWAAAGIHEFWQQFPKSLMAHDGHLKIGVFPENSNELHELQGGEQKTTRIALSFGCQSTPEIPDLLHVLAPLEARCETDWLAATRAISRLPSSQERLRPEWHTIAQVAIAGERSMFAKREVVDEFGWRNFGDLWADHEEAYYDGPRPIVSHYNNQYDALEGLLLSYLLTGDQRYWALADPLARHVIDIDIYHTTQDRAAYNGGLFWHTNHYLEAATSTHRAYSATNHPAGGGGPSNEHNYSSGLLLYYRLTGNRLAHEVVIGLAEWVLNMDDGRGHILGLVHESPTGFASRTTEGSYHGPGRGVGNSINALLDGYLVTRERRFLDKAEELTRRTIHPQDDIGAFDLGNAERRWSYTVLLQTLVRWLAQWNDCQRDAGFRRYVHDSVLHYARWMEQHETFYLDHPETLEYPTETWAAQEIRKGNVLKAAALLANGAEREALGAKAATFYRQSWSTLMSLPTRYYTRPVVLALQLGLTEGWLSDVPAELVVPVGSEVARAHPPRSHFVPQKEVVRQGLRSPPESSGHGGTCFAGLAIRQYLDFVLDGTKTSPAPGKAAGRMGMNNMADPRPVVCQIVHTLNVGGAEILCAAIRGAQHRRLPQRVRMP